MSDSSKRKDRSSGGRGDERSLKRSKGGSGGKWQTPHQLAKTSSCSKEKIEPGESGIWVTCARGMEEKARVEAMNLFEECAEKFYGLVPEPTKYEEDNDGEDIEALIQNEILSISKHKNSGKIFTAVHIDLQCVLFFKTSPPIVPVDFVKKIVSLIAEDPKAHRARYINRLTPMVLIAKATEKGLDELCGQVLYKYFKLKKFQNLGEERCDTSEKEEVESINVSSYAIRPTIRNHDTLKRDVVIKRVADSISDSHKVDLSNPDQVVIVEVYQNVCGMSVVAGRDWERLKRYNLAELYG